MGGEELQLIKTLTKAYLFNEKLKNYKDLIVAIMDGRMRTDEFDFKDYYNNEYWECVIRYASHFKALKG